MRGQHAPGPVTVKVTPHAVRVIAARVVVLDQKRRPLDAQAVALAEAQRTHPNDLQHGSFQRRPFGGLQARHHRPAGALGANHSGFTLRQMRRTGNGPKRRAVADHPAVATRSDGRSQQGLRPG